MSTATKFNKQQIIRNSLIDYIQTEIGLQLDSLCDVCEYEGGRYIHFGLRTNRSDEIVLLDFDADEEMDDPWGYAAFYLGCYDSNDYEAPEVFEPVTQFRERVEQFVDGILLA